MRIRIKYNNFFHRFRKKCAVGAAILGVILFGGMITPPEAYASLSWSGPIPDDSLYPGAKYAVDEQQFAYVLPKNATTKQGMGIIAYGGNSKNIKFPAKVDKYKVTNVATGFTVFGVETITIPSGYTTIEKKAFGGFGLDNLYRISIPASVKTIAEDAFTACSLNKLTIVAPYGSVAEKYALDHGIHYSNSTAIQVQLNGTTMYAGEEKTICVLNSNQAVKWKSSNSAVAAVGEDGVIRAKKAGSTRISVIVGNKTYQYTFKVLARTESNVLKVIWSNYVTSSMSDYEKAIAAKQWLTSYVASGGTSSSVKVALEKGKVSDTGRANTYKKILEHYGLKVSVVKGSKQVENSIIIAGKSYRLSALASSPNIDKNYTTTPFGLAINKSTMNLSVGGTDIFKALGTKKKITYSSSNKKVATVTTGGKVTAKGAGIATVTMKMGAKTYKLRVRVNK